MNWPRVLVVEVVKVVREVSDGNFKAFVSLLRFVVRSFVVVVKMDITFCWSRW